MASVRDHYQRFRDVNAVASSARNAVGDDWWCVMKFYAALHLVQAHLESTGASPGSHEERRDALRANTSLPRRTKADYKFLYDITVQIRYLPTYMLLPAKVLDVQQAFDALVADVEPRVRQFLRMP